MLLPAIQFNTPFVGSFLRLLGLDPSGPCVRLTITGAPLAPAEGGGGGPGGNCPGLGGSGIGHIYIEIDQPGSIIVSQTRGRIISPFGPIRS